MLNKANENAIQNNQDILFLCQSMTELDLYGTIKSAVCTLDSINHLKNADEVQKAFDKVSLFMEKDGVFIFDVNTIYKHTQILANNIFVYDTDEVYLVWQNELDEDTNSVDIYLDFFIDDDGVYYRESEEFTETVYSTEEISQMLINSNFEILGIYDDLSENMYNDKSERIYFVARKK